MRNIIIIVAMFISCCSFAFQVEPMVADLQPLGTNSQVLLRVTNTSENQLSVEISSFDLTINSLNKEKLYVNDDDFMIIPMTAIIPPGESQAVIVKYIGEPLLKSSKSYRIEVKQLDVDLTGGSQSSIGVGYVFQTLYNVVPTQASAKLVVKDKQLASEGLWKVHLENKGNKYIRLTKTHWIIEGFW
ncbi:molecular chaperone [Pseudoalteromonas espejiana]